MTVIVVNVQTGERTERDMTPEEIAAIQPSESPSKEDRISILQMNYEIDRDKLNRAWLSAMITGGSGEGVRKAAIVDQMAALDEQLEIDVLTILMEE